MRRESFAKGFKRRGESDAIRSELQEVESEEVVDVKSA
jgi:hypothetical protein